MKSKTIRNINEFKEFCRKKYERIRDNGFKRFPVSSISLDSDFSELNELKEYLSRFANYKGQGDLSGRFHEQFLEGLNIELSTKWTKEEINYKLFEFCKWSVTFEVDLEQKPFNFSILPKVLLLCIKAIENKKEEKIKFNVVIKNLREGSDGDSDRWTIGTYTYWLSNKYKSCLQIKGINRKGMFGALPPVVFVTKENLHLLQQPLKPEIWEKIVCNIFNEEISHYEFEPFLKICYRYLFEEFSGNESVEYTNLRRLTYASKEFAGYVNSIPFLALLIFALYDGSYRSDLLSIAKGKDYYGSVQLDEADILLEKQHEQKIERYKKYKDNRRDIDVKNLLEKADICDQDKELTLIYNNKSKLHSTVISEIFECVAIAEGLLQILENAAMHAGGGLLSMRIYSRATQLTTGKDKKEDHKKYLYGEYSLDYFELDGIKGTSYFLEVQISDLSDKSIPEKFIENYTDSNNIDVKNEKCLKIKELIEEYREQGNLFDLYYFFDPKSTQIRVKQEFFNIDNKNFVFHYGLEIFRTLITARKGIFAVCGYNDYYQNFKKVYGDVISKKKDLVGKFDKSLHDSYSKIIKSFLYELATKRRGVIENITRNKKINGTTYRMLLPLNHNILNSSSVVNSEIEISTNDAYADELSVCVVNLNELYKCITTKKVGIQDKRQRIKDISSLFHNKYNKLKKTFGFKENENKIVLCVDFYGNKSFAYFEEVIKGCVLFVLDELDVCDNKYKKSSDFILPIAIVNLSPFQLIEATRVLAIFYSNNAIADNNNFNNFQFYLKSTDGKDLLFAGKDIAEVRESLLKTAMTNGTMSNDISIVEQLLRRMTING